MDNRAEVREFLMSRRAKITPQQAGLPEFGNRRVPGLRRGEVATLAGVSIEYYSKLERGGLAGVSASVLDAIARALALDDAERAHLFNLAHAADGTSAGMRPRRRPAKRWAPRPSLQWVLDQFTAPAIVRNGRMDLLAVNHLGRAMHSSLYDSDPSRPPNFARYTFLYEDSHSFYPNWEQAADTCVAILRTEAGRDPHDKACCTTSSASYPPAAQISAAGGEPTTSATTVPAARPSTIRSSVTSSWPTKAST